MSNNNITSYIEEDLTITIDPAIQESAWKFSQQLPSPGGKWRAYLNQLAIQTFLAWFKEDEEFSTLATSPKSNRETWEQVNGGEIILGEQTLVIIPSEDYDTSELRVPQEWIDIPSWAGDYYIVAQIDTTDNEIRFWGYTTHKVIKEKGDYDKSDRTYSLDADELIRNMDVLWITRSLNPTQQTKAALQPLSEFNPQQLDNLVLRLGKPDLVFPRLEVPFPLWATLLENQTYRKKWYQQRLGEPQRKPILMWFTEGIDEVNKQIGWLYIELKSELAISKSLAKETPTGIIARRLTIAEKAYELQIKPEQTNTWHFSLHSLEIGGMIPAGFKLRLLTENGESFEGNECSAAKETECLELTIELDLGDGLIWETEPKAENYQPEIIMF